MRYFTFALLGLLACEPPDPVHDRAVERLGDDSAPANELHRPGQPCATCHTDFAMGGTVFDPASNGVEGVRVDLVDAVGTSPPPTFTNRAGNFYIEKSTWEPVFPVMTTITKDNVTSVMKSPIGGTASCADCHNRTTLSEVSLP